MKARALRLTFLLFLPLAVGVSGCASYYTKRIEFNSRFVQGEYHQALRQLEKLEKKSRGKDQLLYYLDRGVVHHLLGQIDSSDYFFEKAYQFTDVNRQNAGQVVLSYVTNPLARTYMGEDHEVLLIPYYKALNALMAERYEDALVECRRMDVRLGLLSARYKREVRYQREPFIHLMIGISYEAMGDQNNAFIAYRNAYELYIDLGPTLGVGVPAGLREDLLRTSYRSGLQQEYETYVEAFGQFYSEPEGYGDVVVLWHNGLGPYKEETSFTFVAAEGGGYINFTDPDDNLDYVYAIPVDETEQKALSNLSVLRVAFPSYKVRKPRYHSAYLQVEGQQVAVDRAMNVTEVAQLSLRQRMVEEIGQVLLRLAIKKGLEALAEEENEGLGLIVGLINAATEQADTRNWATLPGEIGYVRATLPVGEHDLQLHCLSPDGRELTLPVHALIEDGGVQVVVLHSPQLGVR